MEKFLLVIIISIVVPIVNAGVLLGRDNMLSNNPLISVAVDIQGSVYDVRVNDVPVIGNDEGRPFVGSLPINHWMKSGTNEISMVLKPLKGQKDFGSNAQGGIKLQIRPDGTPEESNLTVSGLNFNVSLALVGDGSEGSPPDGIFNSTRKFIADENGDVKVSKVEVKKLEQGHGLKISRVIDLPLGLPRWKWFDSDIIKNDEQTKADLIEQYRKLWNILKKKETHVLETLLNERITEYAASLYVDKKKVDLAKDLQDEVSNPEIELFEFDTEDIKFDVFGNGRLARLMRWDDITPIVFIYKDESAADNYDFVFRKSGDEWIITR